MAFPLKEKALPYAKVLARENLGQFLVFQANQLVLFWLLKFCSIVRHTRIIHQVCVSGLVQISEAMKGNPLMSHLKIRQ